MKDKINEARPEIKDATVAPEIREMFDDLYKELNEGEQKILDVILAHAIWQYVYNGEELCYQDIGKIIGVSNAGAKKIEGRAMDKLKKTMLKKGIKKSGDAY